MCRRFWRGLLNGIEAAGQDNCRCRCAALPDERGHLRWPYALSSLPKLALITASTSAARSLR
jgi:hypothetical protein